MTLKEVKMTLEECMEDEVNMRLGWLKDILLAKIMVDQLPDEIKNLGGTADSNGGKLTINMYGGREDMEVCAKYGVVFETPTISSYSGKFTTTGVLNEHIHFNVCDAPMPPNCKVVEFQRVVTTYGIECADII
jgi:hypothetical protein